MTVRLSILVQSPIVSGASAADAYVADELMVVTISGDYARRLRSYGIAGRGISPQLTPRTSPPEGGEGIFPGQSA